jgi:hypothetical protein
MKRTDQERIERELKRVQKREKSADRRTMNSMGEYIKGLSALLRHDGDAIYNTLDDEEILEVLENMKEDLPEKDWNKVIRKAVNMTKVVQRETAVDELNSLLE